MATQDPIYLLIRLLKKNYKKNLTPKHNNSNNNFKKKFNLQTEIEKLINELDDDSFFMLLTEPNLSQILKYIKSPIFKAMGLEYHLALKLLNILFSNSDRDSNNNLIYTEIRRNTNYMDFLLIQDKILIQSMIARLQLLYDFKQRSNTTIKQVIKKFQEFIKLSYILCFLNGLDINKSFNSGNTSSNNSSDTSSNDNQRKLHKKVYNIDKTLEYLKDAEIMEIMKTDFVYYINKYKSERPASRISLKFKNNKNNLTRKVRNTVSQWPPETRV